jgi:hypothetical protein
MDLLDTQLYSIIGEQGFTRLVAAFYRRIQPMTFSAPSIRRMISQVPRPAFGSSSSSDSAVRITIPSSAVTLACECATRRFRSI